MAQNSENKEGCMTWTRFPRWEKHVFRSHAHGSNEENKGIK
jgi:hypothetical protein